MQQPAAQYGWDDDAPPPLGNLQDQLHAAQLASSIIGTDGLQAGELRPAAVTDNLGRDELAKLQISDRSSKESKQPFKKGFLCTGKSGDGSKHTSSSKHTPFIKAKQQHQQPGSKAIPDFLKVPPDEQQQCADAVKSQLLSALQPTPDTMSAVAQDSTLLAGFDDPEVMAAVAEVARDPKAISKYGNNPKVQKFYQAMGRLVGSRLEQMGTRVL